ncbi:unnamed protein product [Macrosiphum euphorbiae]|uniref:Uncharacterized protein n=1 Tax=Macrosiphum euphorbiae TaxID=13131 RepID=A0AAV0XGW7_9HEMI|nr:unnamed protein product [Macrosiphum euphorbiae]
MKKDDMPKNSSGSVVGVVVDGWMWGGKWGEGVIRKENDEEEFTGETDTETNPAVAVAAVRFNEAQKTASSEKSAFSNSRGLDII